MARRRPPATEAEREARRQQDRERLEQALSELLTSDGWKRWLKARAVLHGYSAHNTLLIAQQAHARGIEPTYVAGFKAWLRLGRCVRKGERGLRIWAPMRIKQRDERGEQTDERALRFRLASVFDICQTEALPDREPAPLAPPSEPIEGDSHADLLAPLGHLAAELGFEVRTLALEGTVEGWCDQDRREIAIADGLPANRRVRLLVHELAHALGVGYEQFGRGRAEVIVDAVTYIVCASAGLDVSCESVSYVAGWGGEDAAQTVRETAELIDSLARRLEQAIAPEAEAEAA
jgi:N-terminal domain of anti-restriction factor ArdC